MSRPLRTEDHGRILLLHLGGDGPQALLSAADCAAAVEALGVAEGRPDLDALVISGGPERFCGGGPLAALQARDPAADVAARLAALDALHDLLLSLQQLELPTVVAVEGEAAGAGCALVAAADLRVASSAARFLPHGTGHLRSEGAADQTLAATLPAPVFLDSLWSGSALDAPRLHALGWLSRLSPPGQALREALALATQISQRGMDRARLLAARRPDAGPPLHERLARERQALLGHWARTAAAQGPAEAARGAGRPAAAIPPAGPSTPSSAGMPGPPPSGPAHRTDA